MFANGQLYGAMKNNLFARLESSYLDWKSGKLSQSEMALYFFILSHAIKYPNIKLNEFIFSNIIDQKILSQIVFKKVKGKALEALKKWISGDWNFYLTDKILSPFEVLSLQAQGIRPVTIKLQDQARMILHKQDALEFFLHDLEHGYMFFHDQELKSMQVSFFQNMLASLNQHVWDRYLEDDLFREKFYYVISDMNTHQEHYRHYLKSLVSQNDSTLVDQLFTGIQN